MNNIFFLFILLPSVSLFANLASPTERYLLQHTHDDIKYNMRLDGATFEQKPIFDKALAQEAEGFVGYFAASSEFRTYQDLIRLIFEEKLGRISPKDFHFLAVPGYPKRTIKQLHQVYTHYFERSNNLHSIIPQLFPFHPALYANYNQLGYCPAKSFAIGENYPYTEDIVWLFNHLGIDRAVIEQAQGIRKVYFATEDRLLLQLFDASHEPYACIDARSYPAWPSGHPSHNISLSDYALGLIQEIPRKFFLLLDERTILNPQGPLVIKRYTKIQPSALKAYEEELRQLIKSANSDLERCQAYLNELQTLWSPPS